MRVCGIFVGISWLDSLFFSAWRWGKCQFYTCMASMDGTKKVTCIDSEWDGFRIPFVPLSSYANLLGTLNCANKSCVTTKRRTFLQDPTVSDNTASQCSSHHLAPACSSYPSLSPSLPILPWPIGAHGNHRASRHGILFTGPSHM